MPGFYAGGPTDLVARAFADQLGRSTSQDALAAQGIAVIANTPEQAVPFFKSELDKHTALVKKSGATADCWRVPAG